MLINHSIHEEGPPTTESTNNDRVFSQNLTSTAFDPEVPACRSGVERGLPAVAGTEKGGHKGQVNSGAAA
jgi:hypothetical protein